MKNAYDKLAIDVIGIGIAPVSWSDPLEQVCPLGIKPFFVMDETARTGP